MYSFTITLQVGTLRDATIVISVQFISILKYAHIRPLKTDPNL